ncbi:MAG: hypothetical protein H3C54_10215 [Taibaiella sp.]|nr:hypothetical protein [Taibaiella sp.]
MKPKTHITPTSSSRPTGGIFISAVFPGEIRAELTIVNKQVLISSNTINYNGMISATAEPGNTIVNKIGTFLAKISQLKTQDLHPITALADYRIAALTNCHIIKLSLPPKKQIS